MLTSPCRELLTRLTSSSQLLLQAWCSVQTSLVNRLLLSHFLPPFLDVTSSRQQVLLNSPTAEVVSGAAAHMRLTSAFAGPAGLTLSENPSTPLHDAHGCADGATGHRSCWPLSPTGLPRPHTPVLGPVGLTDLAAAAAALLPSQLAADLEHAAAMFGHDDADGSFDCLPPAAAAVATGPHAVPAGGELAAAAADLAGGVGLGPWLDRQATTAAAASPGQVSDGSSSPAAAAVLALGWVPPSGAAAVGGPAGAAAARGTYPTTAAAAGNPDCMGVDVGVGCMHLPDSPSCASHAAAATVLHLAHDWDDVTVLQGHLSVPSSSDPDLQAAVEAATAGKDVSLLSPGSAPHTGVCIPARAAGAAAAADGVRLWARAANAAGGGDDALLLRRQLAECQQQLAAKCREARALRGQLTEQEQEMSQLKKDKAGLAQQVERQGKELQGLRCQAAAQRKAQVQVQGIMLGLYKQQQQQQQPCGLPKLPPLHVPGSAVHAATLGSAPEGSGGGLLLPVSPMRCPAKKTGRRTIIPRLESAGLPSSPAAAAAGGPAAAGSADTATEAAAGGGTATPASPAALADGDHTLQRQLAASKQLVGFLQEQLKAVQVRSSVTQQQQELELTALRGWLASAGIDVTALRQVLLLSGQQQQRQQLKQQQVVAAAGAMAAQEAAAAAATAAAAAMGAKRAAAAAEGQAGVQADKQHAAAASAVGAVKEPVLTPAAAGSKPAPAGSSSGTTAAAAASGGTGSEEKYISAAAVFSRQPLLLPQQLQALQQQQQQSKAAVTPAAPAAGGTGDKPLVLAACSASAAANGPHAVSAAGVTAAASGPTGPTSSGTTEATAGAAAGPRKRGRPKGSKNRPKVSAQPTAAAAAAAAEGVARTTEATAAEAAAAEAAAAAAMAAVAGVTGRGTKRTAEAAAAAKTLQAATTGPAAPAAAVAAPALGLTTGQKAAMPALLPTGLPTANLQSLLSINAAAAAQLSRYAATAGPAAAAQLQLALAAAAAGAAAAASGQPLNMQMLLSPSAVQLSPAVMAAAAAGAAGGAGSTAGGAGATGVAGVPAAQRGLMAALQAVTAVKPTAAAAAATAAATSGDLPGSAGRPGLHLAGPSSSSD